MYENDDGTCFDDCKPTREGDWNVPGYESQEEGMEDRQMGYIPCVGGTVSYGEVFQVQDYGIDLHGYDDAHGPLWTARGFHQVGPVEPPRDWNRPVGSPEICFLASQDISRTLS